MDQGDDAEGVELRAFVPVNLRARDDENHLGNRFGLVALVLPVGIEHPFMRLYEVRRRVQELKGSYQALAAMGDLRRGRHVSGAGAKGGAGDTIGQGHRGHDQRARAAAAAVYGRRRLAQQMVWVPQSGNVGMGVSILSYNGHVQFGLMTDKNWFRPGSIVNRFAPEFEKLVLMCCSNRPNRETSAQGAGEEKAARRAARTGGGLTALRFARSGCGAHLIPCNSDFASSTSRRSIASTGLQAPASS